MLPEWRKEMQSRRKLEGIDVSHWEGRIDFFEVRRAGIRIVYIKASEGDRGVDPDFERNYREAQTAGLKIGFYHYLTARTVEEGREQARYFAGVIREKHYEACPVMDFESFGDLDREQINAVSLAFLRELEMLTEKMVAVYSDASNAANVFDERLAFYPLWIAEYGVKRPEMTMTGVSGPDGSIRTQGASEGSREPWIVITSRRRSWQTEVPCFAHENVRKRIIR